MIEKASDGFYHPSNEDEVSQLIKRASSEGLKLRVRGSAHSVPAAIFTSPTEDTSRNDRDINIILDNMMGMEFDDATMQVRVQGGCHFGKDPADPTRKSKVENSLIYHLQQRRWALPATGGIIHQTMGGFLSTGSSGGSLQYSLSSAVIAIEVVDGTGELRKFVRTDDENDEFYGAAVSMGLLGVITSVTFQCEPDFNITGREITNRYGDGEHDLFSEGPAGGKPTLRDFFKTAPYGRCMLWPQKHIEKIVIWQAERLTGEPSKPFPKRYNEFAAILGSTLPVNAAVGILMRVLKGLNPPGPASVFGRLVNSLLLKPVYYLLANAFLVSGIKGAQTFRENWGDGLPMDNRVDYTWTPTEFSEMWVPVDQTQAVMRAIRDHYRANDLSKVGTYCVEIYGTPSNDYWLSPAYKQDVVKFDMFWFQKNKGDPAEVFYPQFWELLRPFDCRFHWGKYMPIDPSSLKRQYARWDDFIALRERMDPNQVFVTTYWRDRLGIAA